MPKVKIKWICKYTRCEFSTFSEAVESERYCEHLKILGNEVLGNWIKNRERENQRREPNGKISY